MFQIQITGKPISIYQTFPQGFQGNEGLRASLSCRNIGLRSSFNLHISGKAKTFPSCFLCHLLQSQARIAAYLPQGPALIRRSGVKCSKIRLETEKLIKLVGRGASLTQRVGGLLGRATSSYRRISLCETAIVDKIVAGLGKAEKGILKSRQSLSCESCRHLQIGK